MKHILIIEDERAVAELERDYLEINSFKVSIEETGEGGLQRALKGDIDLIILDLMLPDMDGFEICRELRHRIDIPILIVSAKKSDIDKIRGLGIGADDYITKPFSPNELVARVKAHLNRYIRLTRKRIDVNEYIEYPGLKIDKSALPSGGFAKGALCVHHLLCGVAGIAADIIGQQLLVRFSRIRDVINRLPQAAVPVQNLCNCHDRFATS